MKSVPTKVCAQQVNNGVTRRPTSGRRVKPWSMLFVVLLGYLLFSFGQLTFKVWKIDQEISCLETQKLAAVARNCDLEAQAQNLQNRSYIERLAREDLGLIFPGEKVLVKTQQGDAQPLIPAENLSEVVH